MILPVHEWETPISAIPEQSRGDYHIVKRTIAKGKTLDMYLAFGYAGALFLKDTVITILREGAPQDTDNVWMSDSPMEYFQAWELAARARGPRILVGGLGLGLLVHVLALRRDIEEIHVIELKDEIIQMVEPYLPKSPPIIVTRGDFLYEAPRLSLRVGDTHFQTVIADMWRGGGSDADQELAVDSRMTMEDYFPEATHLFWGYQKDFEEERIQMALPFIYPEQEGGHAKSRGEAEGQAA